MTLADTPAVFGAQNTESQRHCYILTVIEPSGVKSRVVFPPARIVVGRGPDADLDVDCPWVSRKHIAVDLSDDVDIEDLGARHGTKVGKSSLAYWERRRLQAGERVLLGTAVLIIEKLSVRCGAPIVVSRMNLLDGLSGLDASARGIAILSFNFARTINTVWLANSLTNLFGLSARFADWGDKSWRLAWTVDDEKRAAQTRDAAFARLSACGFEVTTDYVFLRQPLDAKLVCRHPILSANAPDTWTASGITVRSNKMREVLELAERAAKSELAILILGETGTGKDLVASAILAKSRRAGNPFLKLNCATLNEALLESELFGHEAGAFTGATSPKVGLLETADDGTVFLDEVAELPLTIQAKLLRVVETHEFMRVGGRRLRSSNIRLISATNRDLLQAIKMGQFREDLYYRLAGFALFIPPLRERPDDILALAEAFLARVADGMRRPLSFSEEAMTALRNYPWPGNARELKHVIQRSCCLCDGPTILLRHLMFDQPGLATAAPSESTGFDTLPRGRRFPFLDSMAARELIAGALQSTAGNQTQAAKMLGISRRTLVNRLQTYGLPRPRQNSEHI